MEDVLDLLVKVIDEKPLSDYRFAREQYISISSLLDSLAYFEDGKIPQPIFEALQELESTLEKEYLEAKEKLKQEILDKLVYLVAKRYEEVKG